MMSRESLPIALAIRVSFVLTAMLRHIVLVQDRQYNHQLAIIGSKVNPVRDPLPAGEKLHQPSWFRTSVLSGAIVAGRGVAFFGSSPSARVATGFELSNSKARNALRQLVAMTVDFICLVELSSES